MPAAAFRPFVAAALVATLGVLSLAGCEASSPHDADGIIHVPAEAATLVEAEQRAQPGDVILIAPGTYEEQLLVTTPDITIRGEDRNETIIDGSDRRPFGIVAMADGVRVENLTVANATFYGLLFTGLHDDSGPQAPTASGYEQWDPEAFPPLQRFLADHVTAVNNGLYGIYAFNAQHGVIRNSYASGSADSGFYIGQCAECDILLVGNVAERNAVGYENANASDSVVVVGNRFTGNRVGITQLSSYQEAFTPQRASTIVGNLIAHNSAEATPAQANGGFGIGIGISGAAQNLIERNAIVGHPRAGVVLTNAEDLRAEGNTFVHNSFKDNAQDFWNASAERAPASGNCVVGDAQPVTVPESLAVEMQRADCTQQTTDLMPQPAAGPDWQEAPRGMSYRDVAWPILQPNLPMSDSYSLLPERVAMPRIEDFEVPSLDFLAHLAGQR